MGTVGALWARQEAAEAGAGVALEEVNSIIAMISSLSCLATTSSLWLLMTKVTVIKKMTSQSSLHALVNLNAHLDSEEAEKELDAYVYVNDD